MSLFLTAEQKNKKQSGNQKRKAVRLEVVQCVLLSLG
jgi:hypothetical protein